MHLKHFKLILFVALMASLPVVVTAQSVTGRVIDAETLVPLHGANIVTTGSSFATTTDGDGHFEITSDIDSVRISYVGYRTQWFSVDYARDTLLFKLQPKLGQFGELVVTGTKVEVARRNVPLTVTTISSEELRQSGASNVLPVISERVPGLFVTERGVTGYGVAQGSAGQISVRGLGGNPTTRVLVLIDGNPQFMGLMGHPLADNYVTSDAQKVEVVRGPASVLYGSNAMGGVINIITKKSRDKGFDGYGKAEYGAYQTTKITGSAGYSNHRFDIYSSLNYNYSDGHRPSSDFEITNGYVKAGYRFSKHYDLSTDFRLSKFQASDPGPVYGTPGERIDILRGKGSVSIGNSFSRSKGALNLYYNFGTHDITDGWHSDDYLYGLMAYQAIDLLEANTLTVGYDHMKFGGNGEPVVTVIRNDQGEPVRGPDGRPQFRPSSASGTWLSTTQNAFYFFDQHTLQDLTLTGGLRYEINSDFDNAWIPQFGIAWQVREQTTLKSSISRGYRPPSLRELYLFPPANENLRPEQSWNFEVGWTQRWSALNMRTELVLYRTEGDNLIVQQAPPIPPQYRNTGSFKNTGLEISWNYRPSEQLNFQSNYSWIHMETPLVATPEHLLFVSAGYHAKRLNFTLKAQQVWNLYNDNQQGQVAVIQKRYLKMGARFSYDISEGLKVYVNAANLLDEHYQTLEGYPMPGRNIHGGLEVHF